MVSTNYDGKAIPKQQLGPPLKEIFQPPGTFKQSQFTTLKPIKTTTYVAWVYESATSGGTDSAEWTIDDVRISKLLLLPQILI
jgi:hypothetical protein